MKFYARRSQYVQKRELFMLGVGAVALVFFIGIITTGWLLDVAAVVGVTSAAIVPWVLHRQRSKAG